MDLEPRGCVCGANSVAAGAGAADVISAAGVLLQTPDGRVLLLRRTLVGDHAGEYAFPGGKVEDGETVTEAARRELREKTGYHAALEELHQLMQTRRDEVDYTTFFARVSEAFEPVMNNEHDAFVWVQVDPDTGEPRADEAGFREEEHPRDEGGKFSETGVVRRMP